MLTEPAAASSPSGRMKSIEDIRNGMTLATEASNLGKKQESLEMCTAVIASVENCLKQKRLSEEIFEEMQKLLALAYNNRGHLQYLNVNFGEAVDDYTRAVMLDRSLAVAYYNRGLIRYRLGDFQPALEDQRRAVALCPNFESSKQCLQQCLIELHTVAIEAQCV